MSQHRYSKAAIRADFLRAGAGSALTLGPLVVAPVSPGVLIVLGGLASLFVAFGLRTWTRQKCTVSVDDRGVTLSALRERRIAWDDLTALRLRYYAARRDRSRGWMQMTLRSPSARISLESTLDRFEIVAGLAARAALRKGIAMSPATLENLKALGVSANASSAWTDAQPATGRVDCR